MMPQLPQTFSIPIELCNCMLFGPRGSIKAKPIPKFQLLHKYTLLPRLSSKNEILPKKLPCFPFIRGKIFNGRNRISWRCSWKQRKNHQRVITRNQHLISPFFILHWFWLSINSANVQKIRWVHEHSTYVVFE